MSDSISWGHIEAANSLLGIAPPPPVRPRRGTPRPTTRELWADEVGQLLQSLVPQGGWYGDWCPTLGWMTFVCVWRETCSVWQRAAILCCSMSR